MKKIVCYILFASLVVAVKSQTVDCFKFKNGKFKITDANAGGVTIIERKGDYQVENNEGLKMTLRFKITWLNDCSYTLKLESILRNDNKLPFPADMVLKVKIIETTKNSYFQESSSNMLPAVYKSEAVRIP